MLRYQLKPSLIPASSFPSSSFRFRIATTTPSAQQHQHHQNPVFVTTTATPSFRGRTTIGVAGGMEVAVPLSHQLLHGTRTLFAKPSKQRHRHRHEDTTPGDSAHARDWESLLCTPNDDVLWATTTTPTPSKATGDDAALHGEDHRHQQHDDCGSGTSTIALHKSLPNSSSSLDFVVEVKDSVFQAYVAVDPTLGSKEAVGGLIEALKVDDPRLATEATHPFMYGALLVHPPPSSSKQQQQAASSPAPAHHHPSGAAALVVGDTNSKVPHHFYVHDDDGEKGAGNAILSIIRTKYESILVANNVGCCVIISRWFGGTMLGPARFKIIATLADKALGAYTKNLLQPNQHHQRR